MTNNNITKAHYDIIYKNVVRRSENTQMDLNCFFEALEDIASRLYSNRRDTYDNLNCIIQNVVEQLWKLTMAIKNKKKERKLSINVKQDYNFFITTI